MTGRKISNICRLLKYLIICCNNKIKFDLLSAGFHLEGPFISLEKKGAHPEQFLRTFQSGGMEDLMETYGSLDNVAMVTLAPELASSQSVVRELSQRGITVSLGDYHPLAQCDTRAKQAFLFWTFHVRRTHLCTPLTPILPLGSICPHVGHSVANLSQAEEAVQHGASFITHLFNAMLPVSPSSSSSRPVSRDTVRCHGVCMKEDHPVVSVHPHQHLLSLNCSSDKVRTKTT